jgi:hypothetical protein
VKKSSKLHDFLKKLRVLPLPKKSAGKKHESMEKIVGHVQSTGIKLILAFLFGHSTCLFLEKGLWSSSIIVEVAKQPSSSQSRNFKWIKGSISFANRC